MFHIFLTSHFSFFLKYLNLFQLTLERRSNALKADVDENRPMERK